MSVRLCVSYFYKYETAAGLSLSYDTLKLIMLLYHVFCFLYSFQTAARPITSMLKLFCIEGNGFSLFVFMKNEYEWYTLAILAFTLLTPANIRLQLNYSF